MSKFWTNKEVAFLKQAYYQKQPMAVIQATLLGRSESSIRCQLSRLRYLGELPIKQKLTGSKFFKHFTIALSDEAYERLKRASRLTNKSLACLIHEATVLYLDEREHLFPDEEPSEPADQPNGRPNKLAEPVEKKGLDSPP